MNILSEYKSVLNDNLSKLEKPDNNIESMLYFCNNVIEAMLNASSTCIPEKKFKKNLKPYWSKELSGLHTSMKLYRNFWINDGKPIGHDSYS